VNEAWDEGCKTENSILKYADSRNRYLARSEVKRHKKVRAEYIYNC
tara:strand:+ start:1135 stop:1272 length:138 start_codon:yes stop_codon:yes gene_type:complete